LRARKSSLFGQSSLRISSRLPSQKWRNEKFAKFDSPLLRERLAPSPIQKTGSLYFVFPFEKIAIPQSSRSIPLRIPESKSLTIQKYRSLDFLAGQYSS